MDASDDEQDLQQMQITTPVSRTPCQRRLRFLCVFLLMSLNFLSRCRVPRRKHIGQMSSYTGTLRGRRRQKAFLFRRHRFQVLAQVPHSTKTFTEGLFTLNNNDKVVYESRGLNGRSRIRKIDISTGTVIQESKKLPREIFGEGISYLPDFVATNHTDGSVRDPNNRTRRNDRILQLTYHQQMGFLYNADTFEIEGNMTYETKSGEGWGMTMRPEPNLYRPRPLDQAELIVSDGSSYLFFWNAKTFEPSRPPVRVKCLFGLLPVVWMNELEYDPHSDTVLANILSTPFIIRIVPDTGKIVACYRIRGRSDPDLADPNDDTWLPYTTQDIADDVLNGIALAGPRPNEYWITGKMWPYMFRVRLYKDY